MSVERFERDNCWHCSLDCGRIAELSAHEVCPELVSGDELRSVSTIVADPPWLERGGGRIQRGADKRTDQPSDQPQKTGQDRTAQEPGRIPQERIRFLALKGICNSDTADA